MRWVCKAIGQQIRSKWKKFFAISRFSRLWSVFWAKSARIVGKQAGPRRFGTQWVRTESAGNWQRPKTAAGEAPRRLKELGIEYQLQFTRPVFTPLEFQELVVCYKFQF